MGGEGLARLGEFYRAAIEDAALEFDVLFGPAYKGIPLVTATAIAFADVGRDLKMAYNRKETKDHGEGGLLVGGPVEGDVVLGGAHNAGSKGPVSCDRRRRRY